MANEANWQNIFVNPKINELPDFKIKKFPNKKVEDMTILDLMKWQVD